MKKFIVGVSLLSVMLPAGSVFATPISWDYITGNILQPLTSASGTRVKANHFFSTSALNTNWFPVIAWGSASGTSASIVNLTVTGSCTGCSAGSGITWPWTKLSTGEQATSTTMAFLNGFLSTASSTIASTTASQLLVKTGATSTDLYVSNIASTTEIRANTGIIGYLTTLIANITKLGNLTSNGFVKTSNSDGTLSVDTNTYLTSMSFAWPFTKQEGGEQATSTIMSFLGGFFSNASSTVNNSFLVTGSSTLQNFTANNASTTNNLNVGANHISFGTPLVNATSTISLNVASSTLVNGASYNRASTTLQFAPWLENRRIVGASCIATSTGGVLFQVGGKTNWTTTLFCDGNPRTYTFTAIQIAAFTDFLNVTVMKASSTADRASINIVTQKVSD